MFLMRNEIVGAEMMVGVEEVALCPLSPPCSAYIQVVILGRLYGCSF